MKLKTIKQAKGLKGKRVLVRCGFDVVIDKKGKITDDARIKLALSTIEYLRKKSAKVIIMGHLGRPEGKVVKELKFDAVAKRLSQLLGKKVLKLDEIIGKKVEAVVSQMKNGEIILLENLRFNPGEQKNSPAFARQLARLANIYVNNDFSTSHREHASIVGVPKYLPSYVGFLLEKEIVALSGVLNWQGETLAALIGGVKLTDKVGVLKSFAKKAKWVMLGGAIGNNYQLRIKNYEFKKSKNIILPVDLYVGEDKNLKKYFLTENMPTKDFIWGIGPKTAELYLKNLKNVKMALWVGPLGYFERSPFDQPNTKIVQYLIRNKIKIVAGGGDTTAMFDKLKVSKKLYHLSSGGGAMLKFLEKGDLVGLKPLKINK